MFINPVQAIRCKRCAHIVLFLLLGVNEDARETLDVFSMKRFTKDELIWLRKKKSGISSMKNICDNLKMN